jgi:hypothetical protein
VCDLAEAHLAARQRVAAAADGLDKLAQQFRCGGCTCSCAAANHLGAQTSEVMIVVGCASSRLPSCRAVQKRLLLKYRDKGGAHLAGLDLLLEETHEQLAGEQLGWGWRRRAGRHHEQACNLTGKSRCVLQAQRTRWTGRRRRWSAQRRSCRPACGCCCS